MKSIVAAASISLAALFASPAAMAQTVVYAPPAYAGPVSAAEAQDIAAANGVTAINKLEVDEGRWKLKGRDASGARVEMKIDRGTGAIVSLDRYY